MRATSHPAGYLWEIYQVLNWSETRLGYKTNVIDTVKRAKTMTRKATDSLYVKLVDLATYTKTGRKGKDTLFSVALGAGKMAGGSISFTANVTDGTGLQCKTGKVRFSAIDSLGTYKTSIIADADSTLSKTGVSTFTQGWTIATGTNTIYICVGNTTSLTPTSVKIYYSIRKGSDQIYTKFGN